MKKLTNLQMNVIVNKIYNELRAKADVINKKNLEEVNIDEELASEEFALIKQFEETYDAIKLIENNRQALLDKIRKISPKKYDYSYPNTESFIRSTKANKVSYIDINRGDIEAAVILSDVTDLDTLIATITDGIAKKYPELKN